jgi:uncharacterized RDD family membrane protein YckC
VSESPVRPFKAPHVVDAVPVEARPFQGQRAGVVTRTVANAVDFAVAVGVVAAGYLTWCAVLFVVDSRDFAFPNPSFLLLLFCGELVLFGYFTGAWATTGRTYGDHLMGLRVVNYRGDRMRWAGAAVRAVFCLGFPIGLYWAVVSTTNRSLQDTVLRTSVIYDWTTRRPAADRPAVPLQRG